jgi:hypothetical protein
MKRDIIARELIRIARDLSAKPWEPILKRVDVSQRNVSLEESVTSFAPQLARKIKTQVANDLGVSPQELTLEASSYLTFVSQTRETNSNKYHYYAIFGYKEEGVTKYSSWNCSGRIGIIERAYNLTQKVTGTPETRDWNLAMRAMNKHKDAKLRKGYRETRFRTGSRSRR